jgi:hypothetical protein
MAFYPVKLRLMLVLVLIKIDYGISYKIKKNLRIENLQGISDAVSKGYTNGEEIGKTIILPASHTGGRRYMIQNYHDSIAICRVHGPPDFFVTFTSNSKWPDISESLFESRQKPTDRAEVIVRVYHMKLEKLPSDIKSEKIFRPCIAGMISFFITSLSLLQLNIHNIF